MSRADDIRNRISDEYEKTPGYLLWDVSEAVGQEMDLQDITAEETKSMFYVDNLTGDYLTSFVKERKGIERRAATYAIGSLTITGNGAITIGDIFETANGVQFSAAETKTIAEEGTVNIKAMIAGNSGVVGAGSIVQMPVTIEGIVSCTNEAATYNGYDEEDDASLRERYYTALQTPANGANKASYEKWALEVSGVGAAKVYPLGHGDNTVDVVIIDQDMQPANSSLVKTVQDYIDPDSAGKGEGEAMIGAHCYVSSATGTAINITGKLSYTGSKDTVVENVKTSIKVYLATIAFTGKNVSYAQIANAIIESEGVLDVENLKINNGTANISIAERHVAVLGTVVFTNES